MFYITFYCATYALNIPLIVINLIFNIYPCFFMAQFIRLDRLEFVCVRQCAKCLCVLKYPHTGLVINCLNKCRHWLYLLRTPIFLIQNKKGYQFNCDMFLLDANVYLFIKKAGLFSSPLHDSWTAQ